MRRALISSLALSALVFASALAPAAWAGSVITTTDFESFALPPAGYWNGSDGAGGFTLDGDFYNNKYEVTQFGQYTYTFWAGWAVSNQTDKTTAGFGNQYSAITGGGAGGSSQYAIAFDGGSFGGAYIDLADGQSAYSMAVTNTTYTYFSITKGDGFTPKFDDGDYFLLTITGYEGLGGAGAVTGLREVVLADYRGGGKFALNTWETIDLTGLGDARSLGFTFYTTKQDAYGGFLTPTYVAVDNFRTIGAAAAVPEPAGLVLLGVGLLGAIGLVRRAG